jgi:hypothetical protein
MLRRTTADPSKARQISTFDGDFMLQRSNRGGTPVSK